MVGKTALAARSAMRARSCRKRLARRTKDPDGSLGGHSTKGAVEGGRAPHLDDGEPQAQRPRRHFRLSDLERVEGMPRVEEHRDPRQPGNGLLEELQLFPDQVGRDR
jgi:hypothetical protein